VALTGFGAAETSERECSIHGAAMAYRLTILAAVTKLAAMWLPRTAMVAPPCKQSLMPGASILPAITQ